LSDGDFRQRYRCYRSRNLCRSLGQALRTVDKRSSDVADDQRVVILSGLVGNNPGIDAVHRIELVLSNIGDPGCVAKKEPLNGNDLHCIDNVVAIHISSRQPAS
jgi:hypothetical protein